MLATLAHTYRWILATDAGGGAFFELNANTCCHNSSQSDTCLLPTPTTLLAAHYACCIDPPRLLHLPIFADPCGSLQLMLAAMLSLNLLPTLATTIAANRLVLATHIDHSLLQPSNP